MRRLHWGCGTCATPGWLNVDRRLLGGVDLVSEIRDGLPLASESCDCAVSIHALQDLPYLDVVPALRELRRVLRPGGALRLGLPDLDRAIAAYCRAEPGYFLIPDSDAASLGGKLVAQIVWYGSSRTPFTYAAIEEMLDAAGFASIRRAAFGETQHPQPGITALDNRERESLFVEAVRA